MSELLSPVGNMEMALAAIHNGADAIYVGFPHFNARGRAHDFATDDLRNIIETCHLYGVRTHLALNILIFPQEIPAVIDALAKILPLKPDALIIQDLGLAKLVRKMAPDQVIHASTQMTVTSHEAIQLVEDLNIGRFVLGRENSISEIQQIQKLTGKDLEVFVHGALCVSYSGQCFTSEAIGGRSANRGQCAQSCRFGYEVLVDGETKKMVDKKYVVSPKDLCGIAEIPSLIENGVASFKIEGRLKSPEYVAAATREYRQAIDRHQSSKPLSPLEVEGSKQRLSTTYSRGFFPGWLHGVNHQELVDGSSKSHRGLEIGRVIEAEENTMVVELNEPTLELSPGDGLLWVARDLVETGAQIYSVQKNRAGKIRIEFANEINVDARQIGASVFLNSRSEQKKQLRKSFQDHHLFKRIEVAIKVDARIGHSLKVKMFDGRFTCESEGETLVEGAKNRAVDDKFFKDELGALGGTPFILKSFAVDRADNSPIFYSHRELKEIRRDLCRQLEKLRRENRVWGDETAVLDSREIHNWSESLKSSSAVDLESTRNAPRFNILLREKAQLADLLVGIQRGEIAKDEIDCVILDFEFGQDYQSSVLSLKSENIRCGIATTRVLKPKEYLHFNRIERLNPDVILLRNLGALQYFTQIHPFAGELRGDFSLNVTNHLTADYLLGKGLRSVTASYDLNVEQVADLLKSTTARRVEVTIHQHMPAFHMEHCVFAALLSQGKSFRDCGKPCERHRVQLKDEFGNRHEIKADPECRNTMFNSTANSAARYFDVWRSLNLGAVRYEALFERGQELVSKIAAYQKLIAKKKTASDLVADLKLTEVYGLGEGPLAKTSEYRSIKKTCDSAVTN